MTRLLCILPSRLYWIVALTRFVLKKTLYLTLFYYSFYIYSFDYSLTSDFDSGDLRHVADADGVADSVVVVVIVDAAAAVDVALGDGGRVVVVVDLVQIALAHSGSDARRHYRHVLRGRGRSDRVNFGKCHSLRWTFEKFTGAIEQSRDTNVRLPPTYTHIHRLVLTY